MKSLKIVAASVLVVCGGASMVSAQTLPNVAIDASALEAGDEASLNDAAVQIVEPGYSPSPDPMLADEPIAAPAPAVTSAPAIAPTIAPAVFEPAAVTASTATRPLGSTAARMISRPQVQDVQKTLVAQKKKDPFVIKSILEIDGPIKYGEWFWDDEGVPPGPLVMTVDLDARVISVFRGGHEIGAAAALLGTKKHPTPLGTFKILTKEKDNVSEKYDNAPMPWSLRLTWSGIMIHGSQVENGYASHGCVGVPDEFAEKLFGLAKLGDKVIITRGETAAVGDKLL
ncbi:MAG: L,D-transpeptidase family protein [Erythrobacter sp.]